MADFLNPLPGFQHLAEVFEDGASKKGGIWIDADLCRHIVTALNEGAEHVAVLVEFARLHDRVQSVEPVEAPALTPVQRRQLARHAIAIAADARVVALPVPPRRPVAISEGGSAA